MGEAGKADGGTALPAGCGMAALASSRQKSERSWNSIKTWGDSHPFELKFLDVQRNTTLRVSDEQGQL